MLSFYSVIQFVPDPVRDERLNFGVVAFDETLVRSKFLTNWTRAQRFGGSDISFLHEFAHSMQASPPHQLSLISESPLQWTPAAIREAAGRWVNSIQLTEPRASTLDTEELLQRISARYLAPATSRKRPFRDRRAAVKLARSSLSRALDAVGTDREGISITPRAEINGAIDLHTFDLGLRNGHLLHGVQGISFEGHARSELNREVDATAWSISDIHEAHPDLPITVVALPPRTTSKTYDSAKRIYESLGAQVIEERQVESWAQESVHELLTTV